MTNRQLELVKLLENNGSLTIRELSQNLYISESIVRRDLAALEKANLIARTDQGIIALKRRSWRRVAILFAKNLRKGKAPDCSRGR